MIEQGDRDKPGPVTQHEETRTYPPPDVDKPFTHPWALRLSGLLTSNDYTAHHDWHDAIRELVLEIERSQPPAAAQPATERPPTPRLDALFEVVEKYIDEARTTKNHDRESRWMHYRNGICACLAALNFDEQSPSLHPPASAVSPTQPEWIEHRLRQEWWTGHGCSFASLYGDDGEMQCNAMTCRKDFKRDSMESLRQHVEARRLAAYADSQSSALSPREEPK